MGALAMVKLFKNQKGTTLPEALISTLILSFVGVVFVSTLASNYKVLINADQRTTAESLVRRQMELIDNAPYNITTHNYDNCTIPSSELPANFSVAVSAQPINPSTGDNTSVDDGVQKITVVVSSQKHSPSEILRIVTYKRQE